MNPQPAARTLMHPGAGIAVLAGALTIAGPFYVALGATSADSPERFAALVVSGAAIVVGGLAMSARRRWDQVLATAGIAGSLGVAYPVLSGSAQTALAATLVSAALLFEAWTSDRPHPLRRRHFAPTREELAAAAARGAGVAAVAGAILLDAIGSFADASARIAGFVAVFGAWVFHLRWAWMARRSHPAVSRVLLSLCVASAGAAALTWHDFGSTAALACVPSAAVLLLAPRRERRPGAASSPLGVLFTNPAYLLVATFAAVCAAGTLVLRSPAAAAGDGALGWIDAGFTAVSAVCVTGLIVLDTPNDFSRFGQAAIALLIQIGGLGVMTYSAAIFVLLGRRLGLREASALAATVSAEDRSQLRSALRRLLTLTFGAEALGAVLLAVAFARAGDTWAEAAWRGAFTAVSAFCNAGFALQSDSLIPYQQNPLVLHVVAALIVAGGLAPAAVFAMPALVRGRKRRSQAALVLTVSGVLLAADAVLFAAIEWRGTLAGLPFGDRLHNAWFQSVTLRTAGFNSVDFGALHPATLVAMCLSMFVGGAPGGTAGGIKVTTAAVLVLAAVAALRGGEPSALGRAISMANVQRAAAIAMFGLASLLAISMALLLTQAIEPVSTIFEAVSALGTVGLSLGATGELDSVGKSIVMAAMFAGRVGPVSLFAFLVARTGSREWRRPAEPIDVG